MIKDVKITDEKADTINQKIEKCGGIPSLSKFGNDGADVRIGHKKAALVLTLELFGRAQHPATLFGILYAPCGLFQRFTCTLRPYLMLYMCPAALFNSLYMRSAALSYPVLVPSGLHSQFHSTPPLFCVSICHLYSHIQFSIPAICPQHIFQCVYSYNRPCQISNNARTWIWDLN